MTRPALLLTLAAAAAPTLMAPRCRAFSTRNPPPLSSVVHRRPRSLPPSRLPSTADRAASASSSEDAPTSPPPSSGAEAQPVSPPTDAVTDDEVFDATSALTNFDAAQQSFVAEDGSRGMGGGTSALSYLQTLTPSDRSSVSESVSTLVRRAAAERSEDSSKGRVMMGFCAENAPEALAGLKTWVTALGLPRGMLHGMDVDGVPLDPVELGAVYVKYSTGGAMTFAEMRKSGMGFDALWRPGDALLEPYDGDFRGVYLNVELGDGVFRQFGVLPTDLFMEEEEW